MRRVTAIRDHPAWNARQKGQKVGALWCLACLPGRERKAQSAAPRVGKGMGLGAKAALAAAKARGVKLGNPRLLAGSPDQARMAAAAKSAKATARATDLLPVIAEVRAAGVATLSGIAKALTARGVPTPSGRGAWSPATVMRLGHRVGRAGLTAYPPWSHRSNHTP